MYGTGVDRVRLIFSSRALVDQLGLFEIFHTCGMNERCEYRVLVDRAE